MDEIRVGLNTRSIEWGEKSMVTKDFEELFLTIGCMRRLVAPEPLPGLQKTIVDTYAQKLTAFCKDDIRKTAILEAVKAAKAMDL